MTPYMPVKYKARAELHMPGAQKSRDLELGPGTLDRAPCPRQFGPKGTMNCGTWGVGELGEGEWGSCQAWHQSMCWPPLTAPLAAPLWRLPSLQRRCQRSTGPHLMSMSGGPGLCCTTFTPRAGPSDNTTLLSPEVLDPACFRPLPE